MKMDHFLTIVAMYVLEKYANKMKQDWVLSYNRARRFLKGKVSDDEISSVKSALNILA